MLSADPRAALDDRHRALLDYAVALTVAPHACRREDVDALRAAGATDAEIHATVQVAAYFNYINRVADALGVDLEPEMPPPPAGAGR
ncbi:MAG: peroxidase [Planctomycetes bacterium]|nr:peroxidase [Planctomycetota bacterium]